MVLLNLAYIPDSVVGDMEDFKAGWSLKFKELMRRHFQQPKFNKWNQEFEMIKSQVDGEMADKTEEQRKQVAYFRLNEKLE